MDRKEVIINLSQKGGSHCRPLLAMLRREIGADFIAKSGNECLKLSSVIMWLDNQIQAKEDLQVFFNGTNKHNQIGIWELLPLKLCSKLNRETLKWEKWAEISDKQTVLTDIVWASEAETVKQLMKATAVAILKKLQLKECEV